MKSYKNLYALRRILTDHRRIIKSLILITRIFAIIVVTHMQVGASVIIESVPLNRGKVEFAGSSLSAPQPYVLNGTVKDEEGRPLAGASVRIKGGDRATTTDLDGKFILEIQQSNELLQISFVGYATIESVVGSERIQTFTLMVDQTLSELDEVVVVGFGQQKKLTLIGAQSTVNVAELKQPVRSLSSVLAGRISGVVSVQRSGEPGNDNASIWVRGVSTFTGSDPLVLVDGVQRPFSDINPEDIESFSILKDASATAVYGVRGANGVILITTKKGNVGKAQVTASYNQGVTRFTRLVDFADGPLYMEMVNEAMATRGKEKTYSDERIALTRSGTDPMLYPNVDWMDEIFNKYGQNATANVNIRGGSENMNYYVSTSYFNELGLFKRDELQNFNSAIKNERYNFTSNLNVNITKTTKLDLGMQGYLTNGNFPGWHTETIFGQTMLITPIVHPAKYPDGKIAAGNIENPYAMLTQSGYQTKWNNRFMSNIRLTQDLGFWLDGLSLTSMFSFDAFNVHNINRTKRLDTWLATGRNEDGELEYVQTNVGREYLGYSRDNGGDRQFYTETALNYDHVFGDHRVGVMGIFNQTDKVPGFAGDFISSLPFRNRGVAARATYGFMDRYLMEMNFGYNGSENFSSQNRYGFFPSVGLGWVMSDEKFFEPIKPVVQFLKFRFSHGKAGNSNIDPSNNRRFGYIATVSDTNGYTFGRDYNNAKAGVDIGEYASEISWEVATKTNFGIDLYTLDNNLNLQVDWFNEHRDGIFLRRSSVPQFLGLGSNPYGNLGVTKNRGVDGTLTFNRQINQLHVNLKGTLTYAKSEVIDDDLPPWKYPWLERKGQKIGQRFGYIAEKLFDSKEEIANSASQVGSVLPGDIKFKDLNGDGIIDAYDQAALGYGSIPEVVYGFGTTLSWKGFSLGAFFQGIGNVDILLNGEGVVPFKEGGNRGNILSEITNRWTPDNPSQDVFYPRLTFGEENHNYRTSSWWVQNGKYLRLKTLELSYDLPTVWGRGLGIKNARIYALGYNVLTFSPFKLWDVELGDGRGATYPNIASYSLGAEFKF